MPTREVCSKPRRKSQSKIGQLNCPARDMRHGWQVAGLARELSCSTDSGAAFRTVAANLQPRYRNSEGAPVFHLPLQLGEKGTLKLRYLATAYAGHMQMLAAGASLVKMALAFHMHEIEFIHETLALQ
jgi:hypothetical protein